MRQKVKDSAKRTKEGLIKNQKPLMYSYIVYRMGYSVFLSLFLINLSSKDLNLIAYLFILFNFFYSGLSGWIISKITIFSLLSEYQKLKKLISIYSAAFIISRAILIAYIGTASKGFLVAALVYSLISATFFIRQVFNSIKSKKAIKVKTLNTVII